MAAQSHSAAKSTIGATAPDLSKINADAVTSHLAELNATATRDRESEAWVMLEMGRALCVLKEANRHAEFLPIIKSIGLNKGTSSRYMKAARRILRVDRQADLQKLLAIGRSGLIELMSLEEEEFEQLAMTGEYCGLRLDELPGMTVMEIRRAVKSINEDDEQVHALMPDKHAAIDALCEGPLQVGDVVESRYAKRHGRVVKIYPDGSASVCWSDGEPQPEGLGHERMPRNLLRLVERAAPVAPAPEPEADPARVKAHREISAILKAIASKAAPEMPAPAQNPLPADPAARPENVICMQKARMRSGTMAVAKLAARDPARMKAYCEALMPMALANANTTELQILLMVLEDLLHDQTRESPLPEIVAARYAIYCQLWLDGGAK